jgi:ABC-type uncharacterized transport system fused permease/ATPase subunit
MNFLILFEKGCGKSSLFRTILRLCDYSGGIYIGGVDTKTIPLHILRDNLIVIPQDPLIFSATIRRNLDPKERYTDCDLLDAINVCGFINTLSTSQLQQFSASTPTGGKHNDKNNNNEYNTNNNNCNNNYYCNNNDNNNNYNNNYFSNNSYYHYSHHNNNDYHY